MNLKTVTLSYPVKQYDVQVHHLTARHSTAIEWLILEVVQKGMENAQIQAMSVGSIFEDIFNVRDANLTVKPCILALRDEQALTADGIYDDSDLQTVPVGSLKLTQEGLQMKQDGMLPGKMAVNYIKMVFDPRKKRFLSGNEVEDLEDNSEDQDWTGEEDKSFPGDEIMDFLESARETQRYTWLTPVTKIQKIEMAAIKILHEIVSKDLMVKTGWICYTQKDEDGSQAQELLERVTFDCDKFPDVPEWGNLDPDADIEELIEAGEVEKKIKKCMEKEKIFLISPEYFLEKDWNRENSKENKMRVAIVEGAEELSVNSVRTQMTVHVPGKLLAKNTLYLSSSCAVQLGRFHLSAGEVRKEAVLGFIPTEYQGEGITQCIQTLAERFGEKQPELLILLLMERKRDVFDGLLQQVLNSKTSLQEKYQFLECIRNMGMKMLKKEIFASGIYSQMLLDEKQLQSCRREFSTVKHTLLTYLSMYDIQSDHELRKNIVKAVLAVGAEPDCVEELWHLWEKIRKDNKSLLSWIRQERLYVRYYTPEILEELAHRLDFSGENRLENYTEVERRFEMLARPVRQTLEIMPEMTSWGMCSYEEVKECVLIHRDEVSRLYDELRNWKNAVSEFEENISDLEELCFRNEELNRAVLFMNQMEDALCLFFDDVSVKFSRVCVADTCAMMSHPELISDFTHGDTLLVIPIVVLEELDHKKSDQDAQTASLAREVIRQIEYYSGSLWLDQSQNSHPELLSSDLDPRRNDCKILSVALRYMYKNVILLTDDINLRNLAVSQHLNTMSYENYLKLREEEIRKSRKKKKKGK